VARGQRWEIGADLSQTMDRAFERDGFVVIPQLFDEQEIARISAWTDELERCPEVPGRSMKYYEPSLLSPGERVLQRIENFCPFHDGFADLCDGDELRGSVSRLFGEPAVLFKDKINFKLPGGDGFKPHQDQQAGWSTYADLFITGMVSIDSTTAENGCLELCAGHHTRGLIGEEWKPLTDDDMRRLGGRAVPTRPGDAVFFDSYTPHASGPNLTAERRRVLYITYNRRSAGDYRVRYYADKRKSFPPDIERDPSRTYTFRV
jgi:ectoine hydroxylase-related dioxygenase (phytanoyl-CoA dioxygenase family)